MSLVTIASRVQDDRSEERLSGMVAAVVCHAGGAVVHSPHVRTPDGGRAWSRVPRSLGTMYDMRMLSAGGRLHPQQPRHVEIVDDGGSDMADRGLFVSVPLGTQSNPDRRIYSDVNGDGAANGGADQASSTALLGPEPERT